MNLNRYSFIGNLGGDAETKQVGDTSVTDFSVAVTEGYKDKNGDWQNKTTWVKCNWWGDKSKISPYLKKGAKVYVEGNPSTNAYLPKNAIDPVGVLEVRVQSLMLLDRKQDSEQQGSGSSGYTYDNDNLDRSNESGDIPF